MNRLFLAAALAPIILAAPANATTRTAQAERAPLVRIAAQPLRTALRPVIAPSSTPRRARYDLSRMMARNFGTIGNRQVDVLVASIQ